MRKWSKTSFWSKMSMKFKSGMLRIPPCSTFMLETRTVVPYPYPQCSLVPLRPGSMFQGFYLVFACGKGPFCVRKGPFLLTIFFHSGRKTPLLPTQNQDKCLFLTPPHPLHANTNPHPGSNACHACKQTWRQLLGSFFALYQSFSHTCPSGIPPPNLQSMHNRIVRLYDKHARNPTTSPYASPFPNTAWHSHMPLGGSKKAARR